ncbi:hypothetical protein NE237_002188 [Protea cynaroides]|uniref:Uncharacterized protein n=1 Tax=Protea cynaroides TaxID=273540 RepID=A0A9Q0QZ34_9MAGN|nr:hypothetical protein NE237_002188 [Protea cynaroides]
MANDYWNPGDSLVSLDPMLEEVALHRDWQWKIVVARPDARSYRIKLCRILLRIEKHAHKEANSMKTLDRMMVAVSDHGNPGLTSAGDGVMRHEARTSGLTIGGTTGPLCHETKVDIVVGRQTSMMGRSSPLVETNAPIPHVDRSDQERSISEGVITPSGESWADMADVNDDEDVVDAYDDEEEDKDDDDDDEEDTLDPKDPPPLRALSLAVGTPSPAAI